MRKGFAAAAAALSTAAITALLGMAVVSAATAPYVMIGDVKVPGVLVTSTVSPDVAGQPDCLQSGSTCMRDANDSNSSGNPIVEGSVINGTAENLVLIAGGTEYQFAGHTTLCVGLTADDTKAVTQPCNGGHGIVQTRVSRGCCNAIAIINDAATQHFGTEEDITAVNIRGDQIGVAIPGQGFQRWTK